VKGGLVYRLSVHTPILDGTKEPVGSRDVGELADVIALLRPPSDVSLGCPVEIKHDFIYTIGDGSVVEASMSVR